MIWLPGRVGEQAGPRSNRKGTREGCLALSLLLSLLLSCFFYFLFIRRENPEEVRDFVLYGREELVRQKGDAD
jgi:hypothetical protein